MTTMTNRRLADRLTLESNGKSGSVRTNESRLQIGIDEEQRGPARSTCQLCEWPRAADKQTN